MSLSKPADAFANALAAGWAGFFSMLFTQPIDTVKTKLQAAQGKDAQYAGTLQTIQAIMSDAGVTGFWSGIGPKLGWSIFGKFCYYGAYAAMENGYAAHYNQPISFQANLLAGYLADFTHLPITIPFEAIATRMQTSGKKEGAVATCKAIWAEQGLGGFYKGLSAYFILCLNPAIFNTLFSQIKAFVLKSRGPSAQTLSTFEAFILGAFARAISTMIIYPYLRAKVILQAQKKSVDGTPARGPVQIIGDIVRAEGLVKLYKGLGPELSRGVLSSAITLMLKEQTYYYNKLFVLWLISGNQPQPVVK